MSESRDIPRRSAIRTLALIPVAFCGSLSALSVCAFLYAEATSGFSRFSIPAFAGGLASLAAVAAYSTAEMAQWIRRRPPCVPLLLSLLIVALVFLHGIRLILIATKRSAAGTTEETRRLLDSAIQEPMPNE